MRYELVSILSATGEKLKRVKFTVILEDGARSVFLSPAFSGDPLQQKNKMLLLHWKENEVEPALSKQRKKHKSSDKFSL